MKTTMTKFVKVTTALTLSVVMGIQPALASTQKTVLSGRDKVLQEMQ